MINKKKIKEIFYDKLFNLSWFGILCIIVFYFLEYDFNNYIYNAILVYIFSMFVTLFFPVRSITIYSETAGDDDKFNMEEALENEQQLKFHYPKLFIYNRIILGINILLNFVSYMMGLYGIAKYFIE